MINKDVVIIGGGCAGMAAAIGCYQHGVKDILVLERDKELGGILLQCIHNGFGLHTFNQELSGPAYAERYTDELYKLGIEYQLDTMVVHISKDKEIEFVSGKYGYQIVKAKSIVLAMGCYERARGSIMIPGYRPAGIFCAGAAQRYLNMEGYLVGKRVFILGSGDIGLIMARRMTLEGAKVLGVAELMSYSNGLPRNLKQCLEDFNIPLYLSHTVTDIKGKSRLESITISEVDENRLPIKGSEKEFEVDTLLLSVGLIPDNGLSEEARVPIDPSTKGPLVNESYMSEIPGIFACGNVLHVHDLVDFVTIEGLKAGESVAKFIKGDLNFSKQPLELKAGEGLGYLLPQKIYIDNLKENVTLYFRVREEYRKCLITITSKEMTIKTIAKAHLVPAEMVNIVISKEDLLKADKELVVKVEKKDE